MGRDASLLYPKVFFVPYSSVGLRKGLQRFIEESDCHLAVSLHSPVPLQRRAEGVMRHLIEEAGREDEFVIDSAGILSYHQGELPDSRMRAHAARRGYNLTHRSRPVRTDDFYEFDLIIGMDDRNIDDLKERAPSVEACGKITVQAATYGTYKNRQQYPAFQNRTSMQG